MNKILIAIFVLSMLIPQFKAFRGVDETYYGFVMNKLQSVAGSACTTTMSVANKLSFNRLSIGIFKNTAWAMGAMTVLDSKECGDIINTYMDIFVKQLGKKVLTNDYLCEIALPIGESNTYEVLKIEDEAKRIFADKPDFIKNNDYIDSLYDELEEDKLNSRERETMIVYQITDLHLTMEYAEGFSNDCGKLVGCTPASGIPKNFEQTSGKWGDYNGDTNPKLLELIKGVVDLTGEPDMIFWTGDNNDHSFADSDDNTTEASLYSTDFFRKNFPNTVLFPIHGNHEFSPHNLQDMSSNVPDPIIKILSDAWEPWFTPEVQQEYANQTFYSYDSVTHPLGSNNFKRKMEKTKIIAWNAENGYLFNFYLLGEHSDPKNEIQWLEDTLRKMEENGEIAIIIGHISPGRPDGLNPVSSRLRVIHERYQHIIRLSIYGHTHHEEMEVVRSFYDNKPIGINYVTPSITTFKGNNPAFRVFTLDVKTKLPLRVETYSLDLEKANADDKYAEFTLLHELAEEYELKDLRPSEILQLANLLKFDEKLAVKYLKNFSAQGRDAKRYELGDDSGRRILSCDTAYSTFFESISCYGAFDIDLKRVVSYISESIYGEWVNKI